MQAITIGTAASIEAIRQRLDEEFRSLQAEGVTIRLGQSSRGRFTFLDCSIADSAAEAGALVRHYLANALSDVIVENMESDLIRKIIRGTYSYFSKDEQDQILAYAGSALGDTEADGLSQRTNRRGRIHHRLRDFLDSSDQVILEGFVTFRLQDYVEELEDAVDRAVDDFLMEREYKEFVRLLKYFVDVQEPRIDHVHVIMRPGGSFRLVDDEGVSIRSEFLEEFVVEMEGTEVNYEDLLISALITLAPRSITVHGVSALDRDEGTETVRSVFAGRVEFCQACPVCTAAVPSEKAPHANHGH